MRAQDLEPEIEELLLRLNPDLAEQWQGATDEQIEQIERISGRPLPRFYRWFLMRMGHSMGPISYAPRDFSAATVIAHYAEGLVTPNPRFLMIAYEPDEMRGGDLYYDFHHSIRDDARVGRFETLREMIAWGEVSMHCVHTHTQRCVGTLSDSDGEALSRLHPVMRSLGFETPISTGPHCALYLRADAAMVTYSSVGERPTLHVFEIGGSDARGLRRILGEVTKETPLELEIDEWDPPLG